MLLDFGCCFLKTGDIGLRWGRRQANFDDQSAFGTILGMDGSAVQANDSIRDSKSETDATSLATASVVNSVEGTKNLAQGFFRNAGTGIGYADDGFMLDSGIRPLETNLDCRTLPRVTGSVSHDVFDSAMQKRGGSHDHGIAANHAVDAAVPALRFEIRIAAYFLEHFCHVNRQLLT